MASHRILRLLQPADSDSSISSSVDDVRHWPPVTDEISYMDGRDIVNSQGNSQKIKWGSRGGNALLKHLPHAK